MPAKAVDTWTPSSVTFTPEPTEKAMSGFRVVPISYATAVWADDAKESTVRTSVESVMGWLVQNHRSGEADHDAVLEGDHLDQVADVDAIDFTVQVHVHFLELGRCQAIRSDYTDDVQLEELNVGDIKDTIIVRIAGDASADVVRVDREFPLEE